MIENFENIKKFIQEESIVNLDVRSIDKGVVKTITFSIDYINKIFEDFFVKEVFNKDGIFIKNLDILSVFTEIFLAHKTLVIFSDELKVNLSEQIKYSFSIIDDDKFLPLSSPDKNKYRDFVGEIFSALFDINEKGKYFYCDIGNLHSIVLQNNNQYSLEKVKYAIKMVAKAYNISIDKTKGIFLA